MVVSIHISKQVELYLIAVWVSLSIGMQNTVVKLGNRTNVNSLVIAMLLVS